MSELIFKIFNKANKLLKQGELLTDEINIQVDEEDYRYEIVEKSNPNNMVKEGYLQKPALHKMKSTMPIILTDIKGSLVELHCNLYKEGHTRFYYQHLEEPEKKKEILLAGPSVSITLDPGHYLFYTKSNEWSSDPVMYMHTHRSDLETLRLIADSVNNKNDYHRAIVDTVSELIQETGEDIYSAALMVYESLKGNFEAMDAAYQVIKYLDLFRNTSRQLFNETEEARTFISATPQTLIKANNETDRVVLYEKNRQGWAFNNEIRTDSNKEQVLSLRENTANKIDLFDGDNLVGVFNIFSPSNEVRAGVWNINQSAIDKEEEISERRHLVFSNQAGLSDNDKKLLIKEVQKRPSYEIVRAPEGAGTGQGLDIFIHEFSRLRRTSEGLILVIREVKDIYSNNAGIQIPVNSESLNVSCHSYGLLPENIYSLWVEDKSGSVLTGIGFSCPKEESNDEYSEVSRTAQIRLYAEKLYAFMNSYHPGIQVLLKDEIDHLSSSTEVNTHNIHKHLIARLSKNKRIDSYTKVSSLILQHAYSSILHTSGFFDGKIEIDKKRRFVTIPRRHSDYTLQIDSFSTGDDFAKTRYHNVETNRTVLLGDDDYFIISAIDRSNYSKSGFVLFSTYGLSPTTASWEMEVEVK